MFTPLPFPISSFTLIVCLARLSRAPPGINSSCLSAAGLRDSVSAHGAQPRHHPAVTLLPRPGPALYCLALFFFFGIFDFLGLFLLVFFY